MALTRKLLEGMGIDEKQIETIIEAHSETVNGLKAERDSYKEEAGKLPDLQKQLEDAKASSVGNDEWRQKYEAEEKAFEDYKAAIASEKAEAAKAAAYRKMLIDSGIDQRRLDAIMRLTDLSGVEMDGDHLKDADKLSESARNEWSDFVVKTRTEGANPATPPSGNQQATASQAGREIVARRMEQYGVRNEKEG